MLLLYIMQLLEVAWYTLWDRMFYSVQQGSRYILYLTQGRIQDFKSGGGALKKIALSGGRREIFWGISCENSSFYAKKSYFFQS
jgi:hypothetical protein